ncbi:MAG: Asp-tRNA(Asn)/Glu-tRNA(Gln) amidotransferase subunit GatA [Spirochaetia bacterium]|nr:Asp-tRNA(Asn)/Glu-tRNA(Gln) amidotransferase subunit GatA [Spirochaetia bacterium]MCF7941132.1 Asp-tRNA(Asn)/Glu-tRNA(Gln) amidotransferase subunit GatA [Spirochaetia bacterium]
MHEEIDHSAWRALTSSTAQLTDYHHRLLSLDDRVGAFLECDPHKGASLTCAQDHPLSGIPFAVKDNIALKDFSLTCGSKILQDFISPYSATAVNRLLECGAVPAGKVNLDEFGMGSDTTNSAYRRTINPWHADRVPGGSSGGSAAAVAAGMVPYALGSDTGGSVRQPANFCGVYGLKPTYGAVSRYGLVAYASSLETIGIIADTPELTQLVFDTIAGPDPKDQTSRSASDTAAPLRDGQVTIGVLSDTDGLDEEVRRGYREAVEGCRSLGWGIEQISLDALSYAVPAYYTIAAAEASANLARYTGIRYGQRSLTGADVQSMTRATREEGFGAEVKLRILLGTYVLRSGFQDQYYIRAQKLRTKIRGDLSALFSRVSLLMLPVFPTQAYPFGADALTPFQQKLADRYTVTANLAGVPALSFPTGNVSGLPLGVQFLAPEFAEHRLLEAAGAYRQIYRPQQAVHHLSLTEGV